MTSKTKTTTKKAPAKANTVKAVGKAQPTETEKLQEAIDTTKPVSEQLDKAADAMNGEGQPADSTDGTIRSFNGLKKALAGKGIEVIALQRTYHLSMASGTGKTLKKFNATIEENATDAELAEVYRKAIDKLT
jgi:hypothetical protein